MNLERYSSRLLLVRNIKVKCSFEKAEILDKIAIEKAKKIISKQSFKGDLNLNSGFVYKKSVDARERESIFLIYTVAFPTAKVFDFKNERELGFVENVDESTLFESSKSKENSPVVVGFGPAGMFCALALAKAGLCPIVIERGKDIDSRTKKVNKYWSEGKPDSDTNVQFGEGGAGTFSDGKLLTRISDKLCSFVLREFVKHGAPSEIMYLAKPHIGTDNLRNVVKNIREEIISLGGKVLFSKTLTAIKHGVKGNVTSAILSDGSELECDALFLCIGHSARDTIKNLQKCNVNIQPKPFSVGVRIEHLQRDIDKALYGDFAGADSLGAASYTLSRKYGSRAVYSFCMCPGGVVVASASGDGEIVTNGMSYYRRDGKNANSAIAVSVDKADYGNTVDGAIEFQYALERRAFAIAGGDGTAPIQTLYDFFNDSVSCEPKRIMPTYTGKVKVCSAKSVFPSFITENLKKGICAFERDIEGFSCSDAVLTFPETRTSSPVRMPRGKDYRADGFINLYPCGEGAGYAGGITSAAVDGLRAALEYLKS